MTHEDLVEVNSHIQMVDIKGKNYACVNQRVDAFRKLFPNGAIITRLDRSLSNDDVCVMTTRIYNEDGKLIATGTAREEKKDGFINKSSFYENCETSSVGRALAFVGIGIETSICSGDELEQKTDKDYMAEFQQKCEVLGINPEDKYNELLNKGINSWPLMIKSLGNVPYTVRNKGGKKK